MPDFLPRKELDLKSFSTNFANRINDEPGHFGFSQEMVDDLVAKQQAYSTALALSLELGTRGVATVAQKNQAKSELIPLIRPMVAQLRAMTQISDAQLKLLGIPRAKKAVRRVGIPENAPQVVLSTTSDCSFRVNLTDPHILSNGKPTRVAGASVYIAYGEYGTAESLKWTHHSNQTRSTFEIQLKNGVPYGSLVWISAAWINPRLETGPYSAPRSIRLAGGMEQFQSGLKIAA